PLALVETAQLERPYAGIGVYFRRAVDRTSRMVFPLVRNLADPARRVDRFGAVALGDHRLRVDIAGDLRLSLFHCGGGADARSMVRPSNFHRARATPRVADLSFLGGRATRSS